MFAKLGVRNIESPLYFDVVEPKFGRSYLLPKLRKRLHSVPGRPVITDSWFLYRKYFWIFDFQPKPIATKVKPYIKETNDFLRKLQNFPKLPNDVILCTIDVVGLHPNISNDKGLLFLEKTTE